MLEVDEKACGSCAAGRNFALCFLTVCGGLIYNALRWGPLAQLAEQLTLNQRVRGSSPWRVIERPRSCSGGVFLRSAVRAATHFLFAPGPAFRL